MLSVKLSFEFKVFVCFVIEFTQERLRLLLLFRYLGKPLPGSKPGRPPVLGLLIGSEYAGGGP